MSSTTRRVVGRLLVGVTIASLFCVSRAWPAAPQSSPPVVDIRLESDAHLKIEDFREQIAQKVGEPLDPLKISASLKNLYATGRFQELRADTEPKGNGVEVIFVATPQYFVGVVRVEGAPASFNAASLASATRLRLGQPLIDEDLTHAEQYLAAIVAEDAYYEARIRHTVQRDPETQEAEIDFFVSPGRPAVLSGVEFQGHPAFPPQRLAKVARWRVGRRLTSERFEQGLFRIHQFYTRRGYLQAYANIQKRIYDPGRHSERLVVEAEAGPVVKVRVRGAGISSAKMKELLPMFSQGITDDFAVQQGQQNLEDHFQRLGVFSVRVAAGRKVDSATQQINITYRVTPGPAGEFEGYALEGNKIVPDQELATNLSIQSRSFPFTWRGTFSRVLLDRDVKALTAYYQARGFLDARVTPRLDDHYENQSDHLFVTFNIEEGPRTRVGQLTITGVDPQMRASLMTNLSTKPGQPYSPSRAQSDREAILAYLNDHGYNHATASWKASPASPTHEVALEYDIETGPQEKIRRVILMGNQHTRRGIVNRELTIRDGAPLGQSSILESQRHLYDLGVFSQVQIAPQDPQSPETQKAVLVSVEEGRRWTVGYGAGLDVQRLGSNQPQGQLRASPRGSLTVTRLNVGGRDQTFTFRGILSNLEKTGGVGYLIPHLPARRDLGLRLTGLFDKSNDVATFSSERDEASVSVEKHFGTGTLLLGQFAFRHVLASDLHVAAEQIPIVSRPARITMLGGSFISDHRDNPADATRGSYSVADAGVAVRSFGSQSDFLRVSGQYATYHSFGRHLTFARSTKVGIESPYGSLQKVIIPATPTQPQQIVFTNQIPLPERFFMGGSESDRGFSINQAGPRDPSTGFPVGGNALFLNSLELRFHMAQNRLGFVFFDDDGNVFSTVRKMRLLKFVQNSPSDLDYTTNAIGIGVRYLTPVGPLRFDIGYNLNPPRYQIQPTGGPLGVNQLAHIQFFFGVGQTF